MNRHLFACLLLLPVTDALAQGPYTSPGQFGVRLEKDLAYGSATQYAGTSTVLHLDLYKPVGDGNTARPLLVLAHGGSWLAGCKEDMAWLALEMAGRGYVVASINYRLGWHKQQTVAVACGTQDLPDVFPSEYDALYAADSCEIIRAIYRGQQDLKGAIRWLKARHALDSTCVDAVLVGGESAGGFVALAAGLLDREAEKPACCGALDTAPVPSPNTLNLSTPGCVPTIWPIDAAARQRPDLGGIEGSIAAGNGYHARVAGMLSFYGGLPSVALAQDWLQGPDTPALYLFHQTCDAIVPFHFGKPFYPFSGVCNGFANCTPWHQNLPGVYGSGAIASWLDGLVPPPDFVTDFIACAPFNTDLGILACLAFAQNGGYHFVPNRPLRAQNAAAFFSPKLITATAGCLSSGVPDPSGLPELLPAPNPFGDRISVYAGRTAIRPVRFVLSDLSGREIGRCTVQLLQGYNDLFDLPQLSTGMYLLRAEGDTEAAVWKIVKR